MEKNEKKLTNFDSEEWRVGPKAFISLAAAILFFSGIMTGFDGMKWLSAFDFSTLIGKFGTVKRLARIHLSAPVGWVHAAVLCLRCHLCQA